MKRLVGTNSLFHNFPQFANPFNPTRQFSQRHGRLPDDLLEPRPHDFVSMEEGEKAERNRRGGRRGCRASPNHRQRLSLAHAEDELVGLHVKRKGGGGVDASSVSTVDFRTQGLVFEEAGAHEARASARVGYRAFYDHIPRTGTAGVASRR